MDDRVKFASCWRYSCLAPAVRHLRPKPGPRLEASMPVYRQLDPHSTASLITTTARPSALTSFISELKHLVFSRFSVTKESFHAGECVWVSRNDAIYTWIEYSPGCVYVSQWALGPIYTAFLRMCQHLKSPSASTKERHDATFNRDFYCAVSKWVWCSIVNMSQQLHAPSSARAARPRSKLA